MSADLLREDAESRRRALEPSSFIVEAPAGAGKTELLTQRYLALLAGVDEPEEVVAITFTNKAAAEMRDRIIKSLETAAAGVPPEAAHKRITFDLAAKALARDAAQGWALADHPARLRITTIDALCASLARQLPILSRFGSQPRVCDEATRHHEEAARRTLALLEEEGGEADTVTEALRHLDNDATQLARLLTAMLARRDQWLRHAVGGAVWQDAEAGLAALVARDLERMVQKLPARLQRMLMPSARFAAANLPDDPVIQALADWTEPLTGTVEELPRWRALAGFLLTKEGTLRKNFNKNNGIPPGKEGKPVKEALDAFMAELAAIPECAGAAEALARARQLPEPRYTEEEWRTVEALAELLKLAAGQLWLVFNEAGEADFVEIAQRALQALGSPDAPTDLALRLDYRIRHLLVDEFQDTSPTQIALLERLTAGWSPGDGRTLFAVGDPMQSIYRFRKADVGLFLQVADLGIAGLPLERLRLRRNNRSDAEVVNWVNGAFANVFPGEDSATQGAIRYRRFEATREPLPDAGVKPHVLTNADEESLAASALEARKVLEIIDAERHADKTRQIAVLVRARSHLEALVAEIRRHRPDLAFSAVEIEELSGRQPVQDLLSLTRALFHRADRVHWLAVLRAPWCGLTLADLHALAADDHDATLWRLMHDEARVARLSEDGRRRLAQLRAVFDEAYAHQGRSRTRRWIEGVWRALGGPLCLANEAERAEALAFLDLVDALDAGGRFDVDGLEREMERFYAPPDAAADGRLQFMTIHKSKGLEFDTVILPGLHRQGRGDDPALMLWEEVTLEDGNAHLVAAPVRRKKGEAPTPYDYLRLLEKERGQNEDARVLYVAATRAVRRLHLVGIAKTDKDGHPVVPKGTPLAALWHAVGAQVQAGAARDAGTAPLPEAEFVPRLLRLREPAELPAIEAPAPAAAPQLEAEAEEATGDALAASVGTLVHAYLEMVARQGVDAWPASRIETLAPAMQAWLAQRGHAAAEARAGAARAAAALVKTLESADGRWALAPHEEAGAELALTMPQGAGFATQIVDRCFVHEGTRWIIDYKTAPLADESQAARDAERHRPQLARYAALFADEGRPVRAAILFTALGKLFVYPDI